MVIYIKEKGKLPFMFWIPLGILPIVLPAKIKNMQGVEGGKSYFPKNEMKDIINALSYHKKLSGAYTLVEAKTKNGDHIKITI